MSIEALINNIVPTLMPSDTGTQALDIMEKNHYTQLPIVSDSQYIGLINEHDVLDWVTRESPLSVAEFSHYHPAVFSNSHPYDALRIAHQQNLSVVPVIDKGNQYLGSITRDDLLKYLSETSGVDDPGGIIVLEINPRQYSLFEIARICENENVTIISTQLKTLALTGMLEITLKTNKTDLAPLVASFERHDYDVKEVYGDQSSEDDTKERYDLLMHYLSI